MEIEYSLLFLIERLPNKILVKKLKRLNDEVWFNFYPDQFESLNHAEFVQDAIKNTKNRRIKVIKIGKNDYELYFKDNKFHFDGMDLFKGIF